MGSGFATCVLENTLRALDNAPPVPAPLLMSRPLIRRLLPLFVLVIPAATRAGGQGTTQTKPKPAPEAQSDSDALTSEQALAAFDEAWQRVHDTHFDRDFNGVDWDAVKTELRPEAGKARDRDALRGVINRMLQRLGQSHFAVIPSEALSDVDVPEGEHADGEGGLGFDVRLRKGQMLVVTVEPSGAAFASGVRPGWVLERLGDLDAADVARRAAESTVLDERRHGLRLWAGTGARIHGQVGSKEHLVFLNGQDERVELDLERRKRDVMAHDAGMGLPTFYLEFHQRVLEHGGRRIGVIGFSNWFLPVVGRINAAMDEMRGLDGIVLDLRGNTGGAAPMTMGVAGQFFGQTTKLGVIQTRDSRVNILAIPRLTNSAGERIHPYDGPVAIVVDETSGSASEVFAGGIQSVGRAKVFGSTTAGAVLPAMTTRLPNGDTLLHAMGDFVTASGEHLEGDGVVPDVVVPLERARLLAGEDGAMEAALAWIASPEARSR